MLGEKTLEKSKDELHRRLYDEVIPEYDKPSACADDNHASKRERMCWNKGNWLSSFAEISK